MFGRKAKRTAPSPTEPNDGDRADTAIDPALIEPQQVAEEVPAPGRFEGAGQDSGLAGIEAELSFSLTDRALLTPHVSGLDATMFEDHEKLLDFMQRLNQAWAERSATPTSFEAFFMIPSRCWDSPYRTDLVEVLGLTPAQPWNVLPLAVDDAVAQRTGIAVHPGVESHEGSSIAATVITDAIEGMHASFERATFGSDDVDADALTAARAQAKADIMALARRTAQGVLGADVVDHARATFFRD